MFRRARQTRRWVVYELTWFRPCSDGCLPVKDRGDPGEVIGDDLTVACGEGALKLTKVQRAGKGVMEARELLKGFPLPPGTRFS